MRIFLPALRAAIPAVMLSAAAFGLEIPLEYREIKPRTGEHPFGYSGGVFTAAPPAGTGARPTFNAPHPLYALLRLGDGAHLLVLDSPKPGDATYSRLIVDRDGDGDLSDERPVECRMERTRDNRLIRGHSPMIELRIRSAGSTAPYHIQMYFDGQRSLGKSAGEVSFHAEVAGVYRGEFTLDGRKYAVELGDGNGNGRFDDIAGLPKSVEAGAPVQLHPGGDRILITGEGDTPDLYGVQPLGSHLWLHNTLYTLTFDPGRKRLRLVPVSRGLVPTRLPMPVERLSLVGDTGAGITVCRPAGATLMLPAGSWRLVSYEARRSDDKGELWRLLVNGSADAPPLLIAPGRANTLSFGEPFSPEIRLPPDRRLSPLVTRLDFILRGSGGETVGVLGKIDASPSRFSFLRRRGFTGKPEAPKYTIVKADGEIVARGSFEYG